LGHWQHHFSTTIECLWRFSNTYTVTVNSVHPEKTNDNGPLTLTIKILEIRKFIRLKSWGQFGWSVTTKIPKVGAYSRRSGLCEVMICFIVVTTCLGFLRYLSIKGNWYVPKFKACLIPNFG
jgi:hypothetical protein